MKEYTYVTLRQRPELKESAAAWFHDKWEVPQEAYLACMEAYLSHETEYGWYLCLDSGRIAGGLGVIENDFHNRKDLAPNVCAVYTEQEYRCQGIAGRLLDIVVKDLKEKGIAPIYLITDQKDLAPNVCAVYTEQEYRCQGIAGRLLDIVVKDLKEKGIAPIYLITDHTSFYERYGWEFLCMVQGDNDPGLTRMYIHR